MIKKQVFFIAITFLLLGCDLSEDSIGTLKIGLVTFPEQGLKIKVEIAETEAQRKQGLMYRKSLASKKGMLFVFEHMRVQKLWMKNTLIALDVVFLSDKKEVVSTLYDLKPCQQNLCEIYKSAGKAKYMLEVNAGLIKRAGVNVGQKIIFNTISTLRQTPSQ